MNHVNDPNFTVYARGPPPLYYLKMSHPLKIGPMTFASKQAALSHIKNILHRSPLTIPLVGDDAILLQHILATDKDPIKAALNNLPIAPFEAYDYRSPDARGSRTYARRFHVITPDGSTIPFGYSATFEGER